MKKKRGLGIDVVTAAKQRILEAFTFGKVVQLTFSGGKDSIVLADLVYGLLMDGKINKDQLRVIFIDEEAMYESVIEIVKKWRTKFMLAGVHFDWFCIPVKHFNCLNTMTDEETFVCWDPRKKDIWVREMPEFAITDDPFLIPYKDNYQSFLERRDAAYNFVSMRGIRVAESIQRQSYISKRKDNGLKVSLPIYNMKDKDIWLYILKYNCEIPDVYENLYRIGRPANRLRISQFFSIDTAVALVSLGEMYPGLMERVIKREPNAYLCALYWDTEMFGRKIKKRAELEENTDKKDYRALVMELLKQDPPKHPNVVKQLKGPLLKYSAGFDEKNWRTAYKALELGDPKGRTVRAVIQCAMANLRGGWNG